MKNVLVLDCSPKSGGNVDLLVNQFCQNTKAKITRLKVFPTLKDENGIYPCLDCGACKRIKSCVIEDNFKKVLQDDYDVVLLASPIYMSNLPGPAFNLISRFNFMYNNRVYLKTMHSFKPKRAILFLVGGGYACDMLRGRQNQTLPIKQANYIFKKLNAKLDKKDIITYLNADEEDINCLNRVKENVLKISNGI